MSLPHVEYNRAGASDSQPQIANRRRSAAEETSRISNRKWVVEATSEAQHDYNKLRAAHEKRLQQQHLQLPSTPGSRSARGRGRPSRSISPSASSTIATSSHRRSVSSAVGAGAGAGTPQHGEAQIRGRRDGPLVLDTRFHANVMRKLGLVCEFHKQAKSKCVCFDFSELERGWRSSQLQTRNDHPGHSAQPVLVTQASPRPCDLPIPWPEVSDRPPVPVDDPTALSLEPANNSEHARQEIIDLVERYDRNMVPLYPSLPAPSAQPPPWSLDSTSTFTNQPDLCSEYTMIVGAENRDKDGGHNWMCVHEDCSCGIREHPLSCWAQQDSVRALHGHFISDHGACSEIITQYWMRCKSCSARIPVYPPDALPNGGYCSCNHVHPSLWQLLATFPGPMSTGTGTGSLPITNSDFWDDTLSTTGTHTSYNSLGSYPYNDFSTISEYYGPSYGPMLDLDGPGDVQHTCVDVHMTESNQDKAARLLLLSQCWKRKSPRLKGYTGALLKALALHASSPQHGLQKYDSANHDGKHQNSSANFFAGPVRPDPCFLSYTSPIGSHAKHLFRCIWLAAVVATLLAPLLFGVLLGLRASWDFVEARLPLMHCF